jgi:hypothetical protein
VTDLQFSVAVGALLVIVIQIWYIHNDICEIRDDIKLLVNQPERERRRQEVERQIRELGCD